LLKVTICRWNCTTTAGEECGKAVGGCQSAMAGAKAW